MANVVLLGLPDVEAALKRISGLQAQAIRQKALRAGGTMLVRPLRAAAPVGPTGNLQRRIGNRAGKVRTSGGMVVGRDPETRVVGSVAPHRHFVIRGTAVRLTTGRKSVRAGVSRGRMPANPFPDRVWSVMRGPVEARMRGIVVEEVKKAWHR